MVTNPSGSTNQNVASETTQEETASAETPVNNPNSRLVVTNPSGSTNQAVSETTQEETAPAETPVNNTAPAHAPAYESAPAAVAQQETAPAVETQANAANAAPEEAADNQTPSVNETANAENVAPEEAADNQTPSVNETASVDEEIANQRIAAHDRFGEAVASSQAYPIPRASEIAKSSGRAARGALIDKPVPANSPLAKLGLRTGDILTHIDGRPINSIYDLRQARTNSQVTFVRGNEILVSKRPMLQTATNAVTKSFDGSEENMIPVSTLKFLQTKSMSLYEYYDFMARREAMKAQNQ